MGAAEPAEALRGYRTKRRSAALLVLALLALPAAASETVLDPDGAGLGPWKERSFEGQTQYTVTQLDGRAVVAARSDGAASSLYRAVEVDLRETPWLQWRWRAERFPTGEAPETAKAGDDYAARVYVIREGLFGRFSARALNYVWARREAPGTRWPNAFTERAMMWALDEGTETAGTWRTHTRDLRSDWRSAFGEDIESVDGIAVMTDADNTGSEARAFYGEIRLCATADCDDSAGGE